MIWKINFTSSPYHRNYKQTCSFVQRWQRWILSNKLKFLIQAVNESRFLDKMFLKKVISSWTFIYLFFWTKTCLKFVTGGFACALKCQAVEPCKKSREALRIMQQKIALVLLFNALEHTPNKKQHRPQHEASSRIAFPPWRRKSLEHFFKFPYHPISVHL